MVETHFNTHSNKAWNIKVARLCFHVESQLLSYNTTTVLCSLKAHGRNEGGKTTASFKKTPSTKVIFDMTSMKNWAVKSTPMGENSARTKDVGLHSFIWSPRFHWVKKRTQQKNSLLVSQYGKLAPTVQRKTTKKPSTFASWSDAKALGNYN